MTTREKMKEYRKKNRIDLDSMAYICEMSKGLLGMVENGEVTHPIFVRNIQSAYELTDDEAEELLPINRRPHHPEYDPDKYVHAKDRERRIAIIKSNHAKNEYIGYKNDRYGMKASEV